MTNDGEFSGSMRMADGTRRALSHAEAKEMWEKIEADTKRRAEQMPTDAAALRVMCDAFQRLKELGWNDIIYCPKDGSEFDVIEAGSSGIHRCIYQGEWPNGHWWILSDGDMSPSHPILFRLDPEAESARKEKMAKAAAAYRAGRAALSEDR